MIYYLERWEARMDLLNTIINKLEEKCDNCFCMLIWTIIAFLLLVIFLILTILEMILCIIITDFIEIVVCPDNRVIDVPHWDDIDSYQTLFTDEARSFYYTYRLKFLEVTERQRPSPSDLKKYGVYPHVRPANHFGFQFLGTNCLFITDGETNILIDPYFSRLPVPYAGSAPLFHCSRISPDDSTIQRTLELANIDSVNGILFTHAHWDHALDVVRVFKELAKNKSKARPKIYGDRSIINICLGELSSGIHATDFLEVETDRPFQIGAFTITFLRGRHVQAPILQALIAGDIEDPLTPPARVDEYKQGRICSILIEHSKGVILNQGSANFVPGAFDSIVNKRHEYFSEAPFYLFLAITGFSAVPLSPLTREEYYKESVLNFCHNDDLNPIPEKILFTHWDWFNERLDYKPRFYDKEDQMESYDYFVQHNSKSYANYKSRANLPIKFIPIGYFFSLENS